MSILGMTKETPTKSLISLALDPATANSDHPLIKYHKEQADGKDYSHEGFKHKLKEWQVCSLFFFLFPLH